MILLLKKLVDGQHGLFEWIREANSAFEALKTAFISAPMLRYWEVDRRSRVETDALAKAISGILS